MKFTLITLNSAFLRPYLLTFTVESYYPCAATRSPVSHFRRVRVFVAITRRRNFTTTTHHLGVSPPDIAHTVTTVRRHVNARLLSHAAHDLRLARTKRHCLSSYQQVLNRVGRTRRTTTNDCSIPYKRLAIATPILFKRLCVTPLLTRCLSRFPSMRLGTLLISHIADVISRNVSITVHVNRLRRGGRRNVGINRIHRIVYNTPGCFRRFNEPHRPNRLNSTGVIVSSTDRLLDS